MWSTMPGYGRGSDVSAAETTNAPQDGTRRCTHSQGNRGGVLILFERNTHDVFGGEMPPWMLIHSFAHGDLAQL